MLRPGVKSRCTENYADRFTSHQWVALNTFSDLVAEARAQAHADALAAGLPDNGVPLRDGGRGYSNEEVHVDEPVFVLYSEHVGFPTNREALLKKTIALRNRYGGWCLGWILLILPVVLFEYVAKRYGYMASGGSFAPLLFPGVIGLALIFWFSHRRYALYHHGLLLTGTVIRFIERGRSMSGLQANVSFWFTAPNGKEIHGGATIRDTSPRGITPPAPGRRVQVLYCNDRHYIML